MVSRVQLGGSLMSIMERNGAQRSRRSSGKHYSTKTLRRGVKKTKAYEYWRKKIAEAYRFHNRMFVTPRQIASKIKWLTKNKPTKHIFKSKKAPGLGKTMGKVGNTARKKQNPKYLISTEGLQPQDWAGNTG